MGIPLTLRPSTGLAAAFVVALLAGACQPRATTEQLEWCDQNQAAVGRSAIELGLIEDPLTFGDWKQSNPDAFQRACIQAYQDR